MEILYKLWNRTASKVGGRAVLRLQDPRGREFEIDPSSEVAVCSILYHLYTNTFYQRTHVRRNLNV